MAEYKYDAAELVKFFEETRDETRTMLLEMASEGKITRARLTAYEKQYELIIKQLRESGVQWADQAVTKAATEGIADSLVSLGLAETKAAALAVVAFSKVNQAYLTAQIADTQRDILLVTQNMERETKQLFQRVYRTQLRSQAVKNDNSMRQLKRSLDKALRAELKSAADSAIVDSAGKTWKLRNYVDMLVQTKMMEAHRESSINTGLEEGALHGRISKHGARDACARWEGKIVKLVPDAPGEYPYLGDIPRRQLFHNRCKHICSPIFVREDD